MATKVLRVDSRGSKFGQVMFGKHGAGIGSTAQIVHDGDTMNVRTPLNFGIRFLGVDTPEISFNLPGSTTFPHISDPKWDAFFTSGAWQANLQVPSTLKNHLKNRLGDGTGVALNHFQLAQAGETSLQTLINNDLAAANKTKDDFLFFLAFAHEFTDNYGRFLAFIHTDRENFPESQWQNNPVLEMSYNERQLKTGAAAPYFIYPNTDPFLRQPFSADTLKPANFWQKIQSSSKLKRARKFVADARQQQIGIFNQTNPLRLLPYELRFLARTTNAGPDRFVINLGNVGANKILKPHRYFTIANIEDRLFIAKEFVPLFTKNGWTVS